MRVPPPTRHDAVTGATGLPLVLLPDRLAVCRLDPTASIPHAPAGGFWSVTRTADELSLVLSEDAVQPGWQAERGWRAIRVAGPLVLDLIGVLLSIARPLAEAGVAIFAISTFDTDYVMVKREHLERTVSALRGAGHVVTGA
jgi:hypothetical protein